jgi:hypothetical protein
VNFFASSHILLWIAADDIFGKKAGFARQLSFVLRQSLFLDHDLKMLKSE